MQSTTETFDTLKRVNASLHKVNVDLLHRLELITLQHNANWNHLKYANSEIDKLTLVCAELRERNAQLEQMLGAISEQREKEINKKDFDIATLKEDILRKDTQIKLWIKNYNDVEDYKAELIHESGIKIKLLVSIIKGEI